MEKVHDRIQDEDLAEADEFEKLAHEMKDDGQEQVNAKIAGRACGLINVFARICLKCGGILVRHCMLVLKEQLTLAGVKDQL